MPEDIRKKLRTIWVNQAGAYDVAITIYLLRKEREWDLLDLSFIDWCNYKYEEAPYDEYE